MAQTKTTASKASAKKTATKSMIQKRLATKPSTQSAPKTATVDAYVAGLPADRKVIVAALRRVINQNIPKGFQECISYGMIGWVVPHALYPAGYHCNPSLPLPFINLGSKKNYISLHLMCLYMDAKMMAWFAAQWKKISAKKLDMGKACLRFQKADDVPLELIAKLVEKISPKQWIEIYERRLG